VNWFGRLTDRPAGFAIQYHADQNPDRLRAFWGTTLSIDPDAIQLQRKSNSNQLYGRTWRSRYGILTVRVHDTLLLRAPASVDGPIALRMSVDSGSHVRGVAKPGIAFGLGPKDRWFESGRPDSGSIGQLSETLRFAVYLLSDGAGDVPGFKDLFWLEKTREEQRAALFGSSALGACTRGLAFAPSQPESDSFAALERAPSAPLSTPERMSVVLRDVIAVSTYRTPEDGTLVRGANNRTLDVLTADEKFTSAHVKLSTCYGACAAVWPPVLASRP
jgi:hypothetical protein